MRKKLTVDAVPSLELISTNDCSSATKEHSQSSTLKTVKRKSGQCSQLGERSNGKRRYLEQDENGNSGSDNNLTRKEDLLKKQLQEVVPDLGLNNKLSSLNIN